jgi:hypothetical protein
MQPLPTGVQQSEVIQGQLSKMHLDTWLKDDLFHANWWILIALVCIFVVAWFLLLKREGLRETCLFAAIVTILALSFVEYGEELILWDYPADIIPYFPSLTSINLILLPLAFSILYQRFRTWRSFLWAALIASAAVSLVVEPLLALGHLYELVNWRYYFSLPVYLILALAAKFFTEKIAAINARRQSHP